MVAYDYDTANSVVYGWKKFRLTGFFDRKKWNKDEADNDYLAPKKKATYTTTSLYGL